MSIYLPGLDYLDGSFVLGNVWEESSRCLTVVSQITSPSLVRVLHTSFRRFWLLRSSQEMNF